MEGIHLQLPQLVLPHRINLEGGNWGMSLRDGSVKQKLSQEPRKGREGVSCPQCQPQILQKAGIPAVGTPGVLPFPRAGQRAGRGGVMHKGFSRYLQEGGKASKQPETSPVSFPGPLGNGKPVLPLS